MSSSKIALAIDIGGSKFMVGYVDSDGEVLCLRRHSWTKLDSEGVISDITTAVHELKREFPQYKAITVGATIPGLADPQNGIWVEASFSGIRDLKIAEILSKELHLPVYIDNDTNACAVAEKLFGVCRDSSDFLWITVSNGVGGAIFAGNRLYFGGSGNAGEIGHMVVEENGGHPCKCGSLGCLEVHAAGPAIVRNYLALGGQSEIGGEPPTAKLIAELAEQGDAAAIATYELEGKYLGKAIAAAVNLLNPQKVVLGGGVAMSFSLFEQSLHREASARIYREANKNLEILPTGLGYNAALIGAAALGFLGEGIITE